MLKLFKHMKGYVTECIFGPLLKLLEALLELFIPYVVLNLISNGIEKADLSYISMCVLLLVIMGVAGLAFSLSAQYFCAKAAVGFTTKVRSALFSHIQELSYSDIDSIGTSTLINRLTTDMNQVQNGVNLALRLLLRSPFIVFGAAIMAFTVDASVSSVFLYTIPVLSVIVFTIMLIGIPLYKNVQSNLDKITLKTRENLNGVRMLRALCKEQDEIKSFEFSNDMLSTSQRFAGKISALMNPLTFVVINLAIAFLIYGGAIKVEGGLLTTAALIAIYNYMSQILIELIKLANLIITITKAVVCGNRVQAVLEIIPSQETAEHETIDNSYAVEFKSVFFKYANGGDYSLKDVSFSVEPGQTVGIIGGTGSGKTTLVNLICRFYDVTNGEVLIDGKNVNGYKKEELLKKIGIVPQKSSLFKGTIFSNVAVGKDNASDEEIIDALKNAVAYDFVSRLDNGIYSVVEQDGRNLSGGQKQRVSIARALVRHPSILILDDSSSALDYLTDKKLRQNISRLEYSPTVFVVSQRASSIASSDLIIVLDEGNVVGIGKHEELKASCPVYCEICQSQENNG